MFQRSSHIAIRVAPEELENAVRHYRDLFQLVEKSRSKDSVELSGLNFTMWIDLADGRPAVMQEFVARDAEDARRRVEASGAKILDESPCGFHVQDPYGMAYHIYIEKDE